MTNRESEDHSLADENSEHPTAPDAGRPPGWHSVPGDINAQAYWDGERWTRRRTWNGGLWVEQGPPPAGAAAPGAVTGRPVGAGWTASTPTAPGGAGKSRRWITVVVVVLVLAAAAAVGVLLTSKKSTNSSSAPTTSVPTTVPAVTSSTTPLPQTPSASTVAACQADAQTVAAAVTQYQARAGTFATPPAPWSAATYAANYAPLTSSSGGGPYLKGPPGTTRYVIEYDGAGHVWVAPPGTYEATFNAGQSFDGNPSICLAAVR